MLDGKSEIWGKLTGPYGTAEHVPVLLQQLDQAFSQEVFDELFQEFLYHQNTIYTATYAAMPFLAEWACSTSEALVRRELFIHGGIIEAGRDERNAAPFPASWSQLAEEIGSAACTELYSDYLAAVGRLGSLAEHVLAEAAGSAADDAEKRYLLIADAAYRGAVAVANMLLTFHGGDEYVGECPACGSEIYLWPDEAAGGLQAYEQDPVFHPDQQPQAVYPISVFTEAETKALAERAAMVDERILADQLPFLAGHTNCPACREKLPVWPSLLGTFMG